MTGPSLQADPAAIVAAVVQAHLHWQNRTGNLLPIIVCVEHDAATGEWSVAPSVNPGGLEISNQHLTLDDTWESAVESLSDTIAEQLGCQVKLELGKRSTAYRIIVSLWHHGGDELNLAHVQQAIDAWEREHQSGLNFHVQQATISWVAGPIRGCIIDVPLPPGFDYENRGDPTTASITRSLGLWVAEQLQLVRVGIEIGITFQFQENHETAAAA
jgi:hypothetical protein